MDIQEGSRMESPNNKRYKPTCIQKKMHPPPKSNNELMMMARTSRHGLLRTIAPIIIIIIKYRYLIAIIKKCEGVVKMCVGCLPSLLLPPLFLGNCFFFFFFDEQQFTSHFRLFAICFFLLVLGGMLHLLLVLF
jgi:hypothetical protein